MAKKDFLLPPQIQTNTNLSFQVSRTGIQAVKGLLYKVAPKTYDTQIDETIFGQPVYDDVTFPKGEYTDLNGEVQTYEALSLQNVLIIATRAKRVIKTAVQGRDGTVKEYIAAGDFIISVTGQINSADNRFPDAEVRALRAIANANAAVSVVCSFLNEHMGVGHVVVESESYRQVKGSRNSIDISLQLVSDVEVGLEELEI